MTAAHKHPSMEEFAKIYNNVSGYPRLKHVAAKVGMSERGVRNRAATIRAKRESDPSLPALIVRSDHKPPSVPMTEDGKSFMQDWGEQECIDELSRIQAIDKDKYISRNYFRANSKITDSTWNRYFGTFQEFRRQAGIDLNRHQSLHEKHIAAHASIDHYRQANARQEWGGNFVRDNGKRFKTMLLCSDLHDEEIDRFYLRVLLDTAQRVQPDCISLVGDIFDLPEFGKYTTDPRTWNAAGRIKFTHDNILGPLRQAAPEAQIDFIEGNHEHRLLRLLQDATPALMDVLSSLHGMTIKQLLGLDQFEINYIAKADLAARSRKDIEHEIGKNYKVYYGCLLAHHFPLARKWGYAGRQRPPSLPRSLVWLQPESRRL